MRPEWLAAFTQTLGTIAFNVSTAAALLAHNLAAERHFVWSPDAGGSVAFLVSGVLLLIAHRQSGGRFWRPGDADWWSAQINMLGCIAFAFSAFAASLVVLPGARASGQRPG